MDNAVSVQKGAREAAEELRASSPGIEDIGCLEHHSQLLTKDVVAARPWLSVGGVAHKGRLWQRGCSDWLRFCSVLVAR
eukprot:12739769-Alexandrium_andersonii.AAC.1